VRRIVLDDCELLFIKSCPLLVCVESSDNQLVVAHSEQYGIFGQGSSDKEALNDFKVAFVEFYEELVLSPVEELGLSARRVRESLQAKASIEYREHNQKINNSEIDHSEGV